MGAATMGKDSRRSLWRSRWAAIGAAVAVTLGGGMFAVGYMVAADDGTGDQPPPPDEATLELVTGPAGPPGVTGPAGPPGVTGPAGPPGVSGYEIVTASFTINPATFGYQQVRCPAGKKVLSGAFSLVPPNLAPSGSITMTQSAPDLDETAWIVDVHNSDTSAHLGRVQAVCATVVP